MFKNRSIQMKIVKDSNEEVTTLPSLTKDDILEVSKSVVKHVAIGVGTVIAFAIALDTTSQIIVNNCDKSDED